MKWNAGSTIQFGWWVWTNQSHNGKQNQKGAIALGQVHQQAFDNVKATNAKDVTLAYPNYPPGFEAYNDGSKLQLGAFITQANWPLAFSVENWAQHNRNTVWPHKNY